ncbi:MAG: 4'-phosphopantetheinyl transferase superfamily protein [Terracoccus sp.]
MSRVDVWIAAAGASVGQPPETGVLDEIERERFDELTNAATAAAYVTLHTLARQVIGSIIGVPARAVRFDRNCPVCGGPHGRPTVSDHPGLHLSLTRTTALVGVAVTTAGPVGIDVEEVAAAAFDGFDEVALHPGERRPGGLLTGRGGRSKATAWVRKEAALKALGTGLRTDPATVRTPPTGILTVVVPGRQPLTVTDLVLRGRAARTHVAAVAVAGTAAEVVMQDARSSR